MFSEAISDHLRCRCSLVGRQKFVREVLNAAPLSCEKDEEAVQERLHFYRPAGNGHTPERQTPSTTKRHERPLWHNLKKRPRQSETRDKSQRSPPAKRLSPSTLTAEDIDLLSSYWGIWGSQFLSGRFTLVNCKHAELLLQFLTILINKVEFFCLGPVWYFCWFLLSVWFVFCNTQFVTSEIWQKAFKAITKLCNHCDVLKMSNVEFAAA